MPDDAPLTKLALKEDLRRFEKRMTRMIWVWGVGVTVAVVLIHHFWK